MKKKISLLLSIAMLSNIMLFDAGAISFDENSTNSVYDVVQDTGALVDIVNKATTQTVLDISKGPITITNTSVTGKAPNGTAVTTTNSNGYEITGTTTDVANIINISTTTVPVTFKTVDIQLASKKPVEINSSTVSLEGINVVKTLDDNEPAFGVGGNGIIKGTGTLTASAAAKGAAVGTKAWSVTRTITIDGDVTINASGNQAAAIGGGVQGSATVVIKGNAVVNATSNAIGAAIGGGGTGTTSPGNGTVTISENAVVNAIGGRNGGSAIGGGAASTAAGGYGTVTVNGGTVNVQLHTGSTNTSQRGGGMGITTTGSGTTGASTVKIAPTANVDAPVGENYMALDGITAVYKTEIAGLTAGVDVTVVVGSETGTVKANTDGKIFLYLPAGNASVTAGGKLYDGVVTAVNTNTLTLNVTQTVLDISKGPITITNTSVTGKNTSGDNVTTVNSNGYEITGTNTTLANVISINTTLPITLKDVDSQIAEKPIEVNSSMVTISGTNTFKNTLSNATAPSFGIAEGTIKGDGVLNVTTEGRGAGIGNQAWAGAKNITIEGNVTVNAISNSSGAAIGGGLAASNKITIKGNAKVNATNTSNGAAIGGGASNLTDKAGHGTIIISENANVIATGGNGGAALGGGGAGSSTAGNGNITINGGNIEIKLGNSSSNSKAIGGGMGRASTTSSATAGTSTIKVSQIANIDAPVGENYMALNGTTAVYKTEIAGLTAGADVTVAVGQDSGTVKANTDGKIFLYLPVGNANVTVGGKLYDGVITAVNTNTLTLDVPQTVLDISKGPITITETSVTGKDVSNTAVTAVNPKGYEITGTTTSNAVMVSGNVPITLKNTSIKLPETITNKAAVRLDNGGTVIVEGTNTLESAGDSSSVFSVGGALILKGDGTLNAKVFENSSIGNNIAAIGVDKKGSGALQTADITIDGNVTINAEGSHEGAAIGAGQHNAANIIIKGNSTVNAVSGAYGAAIGGGGGWDINAGEGNVTISENAVVNARHKTGVPSEGSISDLKAPLIGGAGANARSANGGNANPSNGTVTINGGTVNLNVTSTDANKVGGGMGIPNQSATIKGTSTVKIAPTANVDAPVGENYMALDGTTAVYKTEIAGLTAAADVTVAVGQDSGTVKANTDGKIFLYLPVGAASVTAAGKTYTGTIAANNNNTLKISTVISANETKPSISLGKQGFDLSTVATSTSSVTITYAIKNAGNTEATITGTMLKWNKPGTVVVTASQVGNTTHAAATKDFNVILEVATDDVTVDTTVPPTTDLDGNQVTDAGTVKMLDENGKEIIIGAKAGSTVKLVATAKTGFKLDKWVKVTVAKPFITRILSPKTTSEDIAPKNPLTIVVDENVTYQAHFTAIPALVQGNPELHNLQMTQAEGRKLVRDNGTNANNFVGDVLDYTLTLRSVDTKSITLIARTIGSTETVTIDGTALTRDTGAGRGTYFQAHTLNTLTNNQEILIVVTENNKSTTYKIKVLLATDAANDPHIFGVLSPDKKTATSKMEVYGTNMDVTTATIRFNLKTFGTSANDTHAFEGFSNNTGTVHTGGTTNIGNVDTNYIDLNPLFRITEMRSDGQFLEISVEPKDINSGSVSLGAAPISIITLSLKNNAAYTGKVTQMVDTMEIVAGDTFASLAGYGEVLDTAGADAAAEKSTFAYLDFVAIPDYINMLIKHDSLDNRTTFELYDENDVRINTETDGNVITDKEIIYEIFEGKYTVKIIAKGYLTVETAEFEYNGTPSTDGILFRTITLLEGDLNTDGAINADDRTNLLTAFNQSVATAGSGFVTVGTENIYGDFNNDDKINSLDLGRLIKNISKTYGTISPR